MIRHEEIRTMLLWPEELSLGDRVVLARHLEACTDCRALVALYEENRARLRALARVRPPEDVRIAVLDAADGARAAARFWLPLIFALLIVPLSLVAVGLILVYGAIAWIGLLFALSLFGAATARDAARRDRAAGAPGGEADRLPLLQTALAIGADIAGVALGALLMTLLLGLVAVLSGQMY